MWHEGEIGKGGQKDWKMDRTLNKTILGQWFLIPATIRTIWEEIVFKYQCSSPASLGWDSGIGLFAVRFENQYLRLLKICSAHKIQQSMMVKIYLHQLLFQSDMDLWMLGCSRSMWCSTTESNESEQVRPSLDSIIYKLCDIGQVTLSLGALISSCVKWRKYIAFRPLLVSLLVIWLYRILQKSVIKIYFLTWKVQQ